MMSENEIREWVWAGCKGRIIAMIEEESRCWSLNGPSKVTADHLTRKIAAMPTPKPSEAGK